MDEKQFKRAEEIKQQIRSVEGFIDDLRKDKIDVYVSRVKDAIPNYLELAGNRLQELKKEFEQL